MAPEHNIQTLVLQFICLAICVNGQAKEQQRWLEQPMTQNDTSVDQIVDPGPKSPFELEAKRVFYGDIPADVREALRRLQRPPVFQSKLRPNFDQTTVKPSQPVTVADERENSNNKSEVNDKCKDSCSLAHRAVCDKFGQKCILVRKGKGCQGTCLSSNVPADPKSKKLSGINIQATSRITSLRPLVERQCEVSGLVCKHGTCTSGTNCTCDIGYKGVTCDEQECHFSCNHGVCYLKSRTQVDCHCDPGWGGSHCNEPVCKRRCENNGSCLWNNGQQMCTCVVPWTGDHCEQKMPKSRMDSTSRTVALVVGIAAPIGCILILILSWYILWRKRVIFVFKIINMFKAYEDDDDKVYDAYVSLTESDTDYLFVKRVLQPRLEEMGHRLYLHARDAEAGEVKSEEILKAVERSRRCIMLLSEDYISNEWCRFEYLLAQHETCIKLKQRIIPILMDDIDKDKKKMDKALRFIVDSVKCLRYPAPPPGLSDADGQLSPIDLENGQRKSKELANFERRQARFWERLRLSMPKKREAFEVTSPTLSCNSQCPLSEHVHYNNKKGVRLFLDNLANLFPFGSSNQKAPPMGNCAFTCQTSTCEATQDIPNVAVVSPSVIGNFKWDKFYGCGSDYGETKDKFEKKCVEECYNGKTNSSADVKTLRIEIPS